MNNRMYTGVRSFLAGLAFLAGTDSVLAQFNWGPAGPIYTAGRARNMVVDRSNSNILYVGSSTSGIFKSTDAGANWFPLDDQGDVRNISYLSQSANGTIYAGTGEGFLRYGQKAKAQAGTGLYKLTGNTLQLVATASVVGNVINRIACHPTDPNKIALATNKGVMISSDGGQNFTLASTTPSAVTDVFYGLDVKFDSNGLLYFSAGNEKGHSQTTHAFNTAHSKVFKSTDASLTAFANITPTSSALSSFNYGRIELAIAPSDPNVIYASCANKNTSTTLVAQPSSASLKALYVSTNGGSTWKMILQGAAQLDPLTNGGGTATGDYAHVLTVSPSDPHLLFIGGFKAYVFDASASNPALGDWIELGSMFAINTPYYLHQNIHDIKIIPGSPNKFYFITDAGIYRSLDLVSTSQQQIPSFQAYYKGLVTGQFNSVSIERFPSVAGGQLPVAEGAQVTPNFGYIGGTGGNGLTYYSGTSSLVTQETNLLSGEVYNAEYSKLLSDAAMFSTGTGGMYRVTDVTSSQPALLNVNNYSGSLSAISSTPLGFSNPNTTTGTSFNLWENYGQVSPSPDSIFFYNDSLQVEASILSVAELTTQSTFTFMAGRPRLTAQIDSIAIRTGTVVLPTAPNRVSEPFTASDKQDILIKLTEKTVPSGTINVTTPSGTVTQHIRVYRDTNVTVVGPANVNSTSPSVTMNNSTLLDNISVTFTAPPFASKTQTMAGTDNTALYYRVFATVFYRYQAGDTVSAVDNNISTRTTTYSTVLTKPLRWAYGDSAAHALVDNMVPFPKHNRPVGIEVNRSARLAICMSGGLVTGNQPAVVVSKAPLNLNDPLNLVRVSQSGAYKDSSNGKPSFDREYFTGRPVLVQWSPTGTELYFATHNFELFRVSHITRIMDLSQASHSGKFSTDVFKYVSSINTAAPNPETPYRTTRIGKFDKPISSISVTKDGANMVLTFDGAATGTTSAVLYNTTDIRKANQSTQVWIDKVKTYAGLDKKATYCSLIEMHDQKKVLIGTDRGVVYTADITQGTPTWTLANNGQLPSVQVFDIEQQTMTPADTYNSGEIYVATYGRGVWTNRSFFVPYVVSVEEQEMPVTKEKNLTMFPNPSSGRVNISFTSRNGEKAELQVLDLSGRMVFSENLGKLGNGEFSHNFDTGMLSAGIYIVNISSDAGIQRVSKLVVNK